jgi:hypothetical protein
VGVIVMLVVVICAHEVLPRVVYGQASPSL